MFGHRYTRSGNPMGHPLRAVSKAAHFFTSPHWWRTCRPCFPGATAASKGSAGPPRPGPRSPGRTGAARTGTPGGERRASARGRRREPTRHRGQRTVPRRDPRRSPAGPGRRARLPRRRRCGSECGSGRGSSHPKPPPTPLPSRGRRPFRSPDPTAPVLADLSRSPRGLRVSRPHSTRRLPALSPHLPARTRVPTSGAARRSRDPTRAPRRPRSHGPGSPPAGWGVPSAPGHPLPAGSAPSLGLGKRPLHRRTGRARPRPLPGLQAHGHPAPRAPHGTSFCPRAPPGARNDPGPVPGPVLPSRPRTPPRTPPALHPTRLTASPASSPPRPPSPIAPRGRHRHLTRLSPGLLPAVQTVSDTSTSPHHCPDSSFHGFPSLRNDPQTLSVILQGPSASVLPWLTALELCASGTGLHFVHNLSHRPEPPLTAHPLLPTPPIFTPNVQR